ALSAVCLPAERLQEAYSGIRAAITALPLRPSRDALGRGFEIKAKEIATGAGWWKFHNVERDAVRAVMLAAPPTYGGSAFVVAIERVQDLLFVTSSHSLGLQVADYFATMTYCYLRDGRPSPCGWWDTLKASLHTRFGALDGVGLKIFPQDAPTKRDVGTRSAR